MRISGRNPGVVGEYDYYPSHGGRPDLVIFAETVLVSRATKVAGPVFDPKFDVSLIEAGMRFTREDVSGVFRQEADQLVGRFQVAERPSGLEAIIRIGMSLLLPKRDALILHSSCIADTEGALVFAGLSGVGKSTLATMLDESCDVQKLSDELLIVQKISGHWRVVVAPFAGSRDLPHGISAPLKSIDLLCQAKDHERILVTPRLALKQLCRHVVNFARSPDDLARVLDLTADLIEAVPCYELLFAKDAGVRDVLRISCT